jgi:hypothetical protein
MIYLDGHSLAGSQGTRVRSRVCCLLVTDVTPDWLFVAALKGTTASASSNIVKVIIVRIDILL